jgi:hypothetical protein
VSSYPGKVLLYIDVCVAGIIWGDSDVTISALTGLERKKPNPRLWCRLMPLTQAHCNGAIAHDIARAQAAIRLLTGP